MEDFRYYYLQDEDGMATPEKIELPNGRVIHYDADNDNIDFESCRPYIGRLMSLCKNGQHQKNLILLDIIQTEDGINALWFGSDQIKIDTSVLDIYK